MGETPAEQAILSALWKALEAQGVSFDDGDNTWIDGHFEKGQLAFNMIAILRKNGYVVVPSGARANAANPEGKGMLSLDALMAGARVLTPARVSRLQADGMPPGIHDRDETGTLAADVYRAMILAASEPPP